MSAAPTRRRAHTPQLAHRAFTLALNEGNLEAAVACLAPHVRLIALGATAVHGRQSVRAVLSQLIDRETTIEVESTSTHNAYEIAVISERWRIEARGVGEARFAQGTEATAVLRRIEGEWKHVLLAPCAAKTIPRRRSA